VRLSVFDPRGVGAIASAHVAHDGHNGVDSNPSSRQQLNVGQALLVEPGLPEPADAAIAGDRLSATTDAWEAVYRSGFSRAKSEPDLSHTTKNSRQIIAGRKTPPELKPSWPWQWQLHFLSVMRVSLASKVGSNCTATRAATSQTLSGRERGQHPRLEQSYF
jgi:hypothetical protein